jgi:diaminopimelate decarboxylase
MADVLHMRAFELGRRYPTPLFVFVPGRLEDALTRFRAFTSSLALETEIFYSYKTNYLPALCQWLADAKVGAEVTSPIEWELASSLHMAENIVVNGLGKCVDGMLQRIVNDTAHAPRLVNLETDTEVGLVSRRASNAVPLRVGLRIAVPGAGEFGRDPSERWSRGGDKFGWDVDGPAVIQAAQQIRDGSSAVRLEALHLHFGSQLVTPKCYDLVLRRVRRLLERLHDVGITITTLDLGGGIASGMVTKRRTGPLFSLLELAGINIPPRRQKAPDLTGFARVINAHVNRLTQLGVTHLLFEPGRYLAEPSMLAIAQVIAARRDGARQHMVLNLGTNSLKCWRSNETRPILFELVGEILHDTVEMVGPLCHRSDSFGRVTTSGPILEGSLVCFDAVGAYTLGDWIANAWCRPAVYTEDGTLLWATQDATDLIRSAVTPQRAAP